MKQIFVITNYNYRDIDLKLQLLLDEQRKALDISAENTANQSLIGNIYVARVLNIVKSINAAFLEIAPGKTVFYSLEDYEQVIYTKNQNSKDILCQGDEIVVQVTKDGIKTKDPIVTTNISFESEHMLLTTGNCLKGISRKITGENRDRLKEMLQAVDIECGLVVRTNAADVSNEELVNEIEHLKKEYQSFIKNVVYKNCYNLLKESNPSYIDVIKKLSLSDTEKIVTDDKKTYDTIYEFCSSHPAFSDWLNRLELYQDEYELYKLYSIQKLLDDALDKRVWLPSGAYLIIEPTEALTVIDVNSGKNIKKSKSNREFYHINLEASKEIARQLRIRNISGMIIIDYINMNSDEDDEKLMNEMKSFVRTDYVKVQVIDYTKLGLMELTRAKQKQTLRQQIYGNND